MREFDRKIVNLNFCDNGKLKCNMKNWDTGKSNNILIVAKEGIRWEKEPTVKGNYQDGTIIWKNGQHWRKIGIQSVIYI